MKNTPEIYQIRIPKFSKWNPKHLGSNQTWFKISNRFVEDEAIFSSTDAHKITFLYLLCQRSIKNEEIFPLNLTKAKQDLRKKPCQVRDLIRSLADLGLIELITVPQDRIDKNRIDKNREEERQTPAVRPAKSARPRALVRASKNQLHVLGEIWNESVRSVPKVISTAGKRLKACHDAWSQNDSADVWRRVFTKIEQSSFLTGQSPGGWKAGFDWAIKQENAIKILEGNYDRVEQKGHYEKVKDELMQKYEQEDFIDVSNEQRSIEASGWNE